MRKTSGDFLQDRLAAWDIRRIFGDPGSGINGLIGARDAAPRREAPQSRAARAQDARTAQHSCSLPIKTLIPPRHRFDQTSLPAIQFMVAWSHLYLSIFISMDC